jgi:hypothetical protein
MPFDVGILVEGPTDKLFFDVLLSRHRPDRRVKFVLPSPRSGNKEKMIQAAPRHVEALLREHQCRSVIMIADLNGDPRHELETRLKALSGDPRFHCVVFEPEMECLLLYDEGPWRSRLKKKHVALPTNPRTRGTKEFVARKLGCHRDEIPYRNFAQHIDPKKLLADPDFALLHGFL